jgi:hypothetical protein
VIGAAAAFAIAAVASPRPAAAEVEVEVERPLALTQELGAALGVEAGGRVSPGGFHLLATYLYRLSDVDWLESNAAFTFGGRDAACFRDRDDEFVCDHGFFKGVGLEASAGVRRFFAEQGVFSPWARAGLGVRLVSFPSDDVLGIGIPVIVGGGVRARVAERVAVGAGATLRAGIGSYDRGLGAEPYLSFALHAGVEFGLD